MYLVLAVPFFFSEINTKNFPRKIPPQAIIWPSIPLYILISIGIILLLVLSPFVSVSIAIIAQSALLFLFTVAVFLAYFASSYVKVIAAEEAGKQKNSKTLKPKAQALLLAANNLPAEYEAAQKTLKQTIEDIRFIYPVDGGAGDDLEMRIIQSLDTISEICDRISAGARAASLESEADKLRMLVKERKLLRN